MMGVGLFMGVISVAVLLIVITPVPIKGNTNDMRPFVLSKQF